jgi:hypothetical protein
VNERRTSTLCADNCFFSCSFGGLSRGDDSLAQRALEQIGDRGRDSHCWLPPAQTRTGAD